MRRREGPSRPAAQSGPIKVLENILGDLRQAGLVQSRRGPEGGYWLARPAGEITVADIVRAVDGPLASVRDEKPEDLAYEGSAEHLHEVWVALRASMRDVLENVTLAQVVAGGAARRGLRPHPRSGRVGTPRTRQRQRRSVVDRRRRRPSESLAPTTTE